MTSMVNYDYSSQAFQKQHQLIMDQLHRDYLCLNTHCILIIDSALLRQQNNEPPLITAIKNMEKIIVPVAPDYLTDEFCPWLIPLDLLLPESLKILEESINQALYEIEPERIKKGNGRLISGWIASNASPEETALHLGKNAIQKNNNKKTLLRYYDPAVATLLWSILDSWQQQRLLGPVINWYSIDGDGQLIKRKGLEQQLLQMSHSISLSPDNWRHIEIITIINFVLREYRLNNMKSTRLSEAQVFKTVLPALTRALDYPFQNRDDLIAYGMHALTVSPEFDLHSDISRLLKFQRVNKFPSYREAISTVSETHWEKIHLDGQ